MIILEENFKLHLENEIPTEQFWFPLTFIVWTKRPMQVKQNGLFTNIL